MESIRPLLLQSPRTPNTQEFVPAMHIFPELPKSKSSSSNTVTFAEIDSSNPIENPSNSDASWNLKKSSSRRSNTSVHSGSSGSTKSSVKEVSRSGSKSVRYGSKGADSDGLSMSQKELSDEDARLIYVNDPDRTNERFEFSGNSIRTAKYSILTFIPRNLFEQFHRVAYIYFLIIAILNQLPQLAVFGGVVSVLPLAFVLIVTAVKDAYEDWRRHRADKVENNRLASVLINGELIEKKWKDIRVGEIVKIKANESIPCDIVLLSTSDPTGVAYVQTINLDGESNLKTRYAKQETHSEKGRFNGLIKCEKPNRNIYGFQANMEIDGKRLSLGSSNIVLRGCEVKNTNWAFGVAVYCGGETKAMLNSSGAPSKRSRLETRMNSEIIILSFFLIALCTVTSVCAAVWLKQHKDELNLLPYYRKLDFSEGKEESYKYYGWAFEVLFTFLMSVIVFQVMIPISLYISMELVRVGQAYFMIGDNNMYDEATKSRFQCRALNINEDLGQIKYVFSDKTGTLTENKMEFRCSSIYGVDYSSTKAIMEDEKVEYSVQVDGKVFRPKMKVKVNPELFELSRSGIENTDGKQIYDFFLALAACNTIVPLVVDTSDPDGLRTLVIGIRELNTSEFEQWHAAFETASAALFGRAATLRKVASNIERNICILGATAIEDKLQQGVPEAIESLRTAGIKVWVLTGDKQETAISIGYSSKLLTRNMTQITINSNNKESSRRKLQDAIVMTQKLASTSEGSSDSLPTLVALIIDGTSLVHILDSELEEQLFQLASRCSVVLCCRVAPLQKAGIVSLVKKRTSDMTLAIGDGANDVSMIQMADVGVGISGQEGRQAVMASDFAMGQFRFLVPLLLIHGHWNYQRLGYMILYNFYRNAVLVLVLFWYVLFTAFTSTTAINEWSSTLYSIIYTAIPTIVVGILDKDLSKRTLLKHPQLYGAGQRHEAYNKRLFLFTMADTLWQSLVIFWVPFFAYWSSTIDISSIGDLWTLAVVILVNLDLAMDVGRWSWLTHFSIWGSIVATFLCVMIIDAIPSLFGYWAFFHAGGTALFWLCLLGIVIAGLLPRFAIKFVHQYYFPTDIQISREAEKVGIQREVESGGGQIEMLPVSDGPPR
ncbi:unnamed protein product [Lupinus luteus]|uniref:Phospholipid-transporting ATPase n=1 Tax=Lupinus luteus TaxID=3873 RepID=A0AAV1WNV1_LUPLU